MSNETKALKAKKPIKMPHTLVIIMGIIVVAVLLTWIIPAGEFVRTENAQGITVVEPGSFSFTENHGVNPIKIPTYIVSGFAGVASLIFFTLFCGAAFEVIVQSGALQSLVGKISKALSNKEALFIPVMTVMFALICTTQSIESFMGFAPVMVMITKALGFDSMVAAAILIFGGGIGFSTGTLNPNTTLISQEIAELPPYSGIGFRFFSMAVFLVVSNIFLIKYALKIKKNPQASYMYDLDQQYSADEKVDIDSFGGMNIRKILVILCLVVSLSIVVYGAVMLHWGLDQNSAVFIAMGVIAGILAGMAPDKIANTMVAGAKRMVGIALIIGTARAISGILTDGHVLDTVVYALSIALAVLPGPIQGIAMFLSNLLVNIFITSGSGQAAIVMPIFIPLADMMDITRQTAVVGFNFGDGFGNYVLPYSTTLMGIIGNCKVPYDRWMKFAWKMFIIWVVTGSVLVFIAQQIHLGPM